MIGWMGSCWDALVAAVTGGPFWWGVLLGLVAGVAGIIFLAEALPAPQPSRRQQRREMVQRVWRAWCASHEWCPYHDVADGQCPPVDSWVGGARALGACSGSGSVLVDASLDTRTGSS